MKKIAVGLDGSAAAESALRWATDLSAKSGARILGVNALFVIWSGTEPEERQRRMTEQRERLERDWLGRARDAGLVVDAIVGDGDPRHVILDLALSADADLLVLGRTGSGLGPGFLHIGSLVEYAAHHVTLPLAVIPTGAPAVMRRIVVGVDGSTESRRALEWAGEVAQAMDCEIIAVQVMEPFLEWTPASSADNWRRDVERSLDESAKPLTDAGIPVTSIAQRDLHPADALIGLATARQADLVVVGARGLGGFKNLRAGGVALKVLHRIGLPLVIVPTA